LEGKGFSVRQLLISDRGEGGETLSRPPRLQFAIEPRGNIELRKGEKPDVFEKKGSTIRGFGIWRIRVRGNVCSNEKGIAPLKSTPGPGKEEGACYCSHSARRKEEKIGSSLKFSGLHPKVIWDQEKTAVILYLNSRTGKREEASLSGTIL